MALMADYIYISSFVGLQQCNAVAMDTLMIAYVDERYPGWHLL